MAGTNEVLFCLDAGQRYRLSCDDLQWILEKGSPGLRKPGTDTGYRGISFVCSDKTILRRCIRDISAMPSPEGAALLDALPDTFRECRDLVRALGIGGFRAWHRGRAFEQAALPEAPQCRLRRSEQAIAAE